MNTGSTGAKHPARIEFVHSLRGLSALVVVVAHLTGTWLYLNVETNPLYTQWWLHVAVPLKLFQDGGYTAVLVFFLVSGYVITHTSWHQAHRAFAIRRFVRIWPPLVVALALTFALMKVFALAGWGYPGFAGGPWQHWALAAFMLDGFASDHYILPVAWTLVAEWVFYLLALVALGWQRQRPLVATYVMIGLWIAACQFVATSAFFDLKAAPMALYQVGFLFIGRLLYLVQARMIAPWSAMVPGALAFTVYVDKTYEVAPYMFDLYRVETTIAITTALMAFVVMMWLAPRRTPRPLAFLGNISYSLYLIHLPVGFAILVVWTRLELPLTAGWLVALTAVLLASWASFAWVERPTQVIARAWVDGRRSPTRLGPAGMGGSVPHDLAHHGPGVGRVGLEPTTQGL